MDDGKLKIGLLDGELAEIATPDQNPKASRRDIHQLNAARRTGSTTVASTRIIAELAGIRVYYSGVIGGVHHRAQSIYDTSADLQELGRTTASVKKPSNRKHKKSFDIIYCFPNFGICCNHNIKQCIIKIQLIQEEEWLDQQNQNRSQI